MKVGFMAGAISLFAVLGLLFFGNERGRAAAPNGAVGVREPVIPVERISLSRSAEPLGLSGRALRGGAHRPKYALLQISDDQQPFREFLFKVDRTTQLFMPMEGARNKGAVVWIRGTAAGLTLVGKGLGQYDLATSDLSQLPLGIAPLSDEAVNAGELYEAVIVVDLVDRVIFLLLDGDQLLGVRYAASKPVEDPMRLTRLALDILARQKRARVGAPGSGMLQVPDQGDFVPTSTCCVSCGTRTCCCTTESEKGCSSDGGARCPERRCSCTGANSCACVSAF